MNKIESQRNTANRAKKSFGELGKIMIQAAGIDACKKGYGTTEPESVGMAAIAYSDINWDGTLN